MSTHVPVFQPGCIAFDSDDPDSSWVVFIPVETSARCGGVDHPNLQDALNAAFRTGELVEYGDLKLQIGGSDSAPMLMCFQSHNRAKVYFDALIVALAHAPPAQA